MKKKILAGLLCLCMLFASGCSSAGAISTYTISMAEMPKNFDPQVATGSNELLVLTNIYDGLFEYRGGKVVPDVCESYEVSADKLTYTFTLRGDSTFYLSRSEQIPVTASDFAFALERVLNPDTKSPYYTNFSHIKSVKAVDDHTLEIKLSKEDNEFITKLCMPAAFPCNKDFFVNTNGAYGLRVNDILSNGPFTINYLADDGSYATLVRVVEMEKGIDRIRISLADEAVTDEEQYKNDKISGYFASTAADGTVFEYENSAFNLIFNTENEILANEKIRGAFSHYCYALENSGANLEAVTQNYSIFTDAMTIGEKNVNDIITPAVPSYMKEDAKELLMEGLGEMEKMSVGNLTVLIPSDVSYSVIAENINQIWQKNLNAFFSVEFLPSSEIEKRVAAKKFDIAFYSYTPVTNSFMDVIAPFGSYSSSLAECIENINSTIGTSAAEKYVAQAQDIILEKAFVVPMCTDKSRYIHKSYFENVDVNPFGHIINLKHATVK